MIPQVVYAEILSCPSFGAGIKVLRPSFTVHSSNHGHFERSGTDQFGYITAK